MNYKKFFVYGDPNNKPRFSSSVIIESINNAAKEIGLYDENGLPVVYDCVCNHHGKNPAAIIGCYEIPYPDFIIRNAQNKPLLSVSRDSMKFAIDGGYNPHLCSFINLGVDTNIWTPVKKIKNLDKFVVLSYTESLVRSGLEILIKAFTEAFRGNKDAVLHIKDRNATLEFARWVHVQASENDINIIYDNVHLDTPEKIKDLFSGVDCHVYLNRSTTWGMTVLEGIACGIPTITPLYSGPRDFITDGQNGLACDFEITKVHTEINYLQSIGQRNFFFPLRESDYWCRPDFNSVAYKLKLLYNNSNLRQKLAHLGPIYAKSYSWQSSARMISENLQRFYN